MTEKKIISPLPKNSSGRKRKESLCTKDSFLDHSLPTSPVQIYLVLFFLSGLCGLCYELIWLRKTALIFGGTTYATSTVLAVFMGGLALGSYLFGRRAGSVQESLKLYGLLEIGIGIWALLVFPLFRVVTTIHIFLYQTFGQIPGVPLLDRFVLSVLVLLPATLFMGGSLPVLLHGVTQDLKRIGQRTGFVYFLNTFGAVIGVLVTGFLLIEWLGLSRANGLAALLNLIIGVVAIALSKKVYGQEIQNDQNIAQQETSQIQSLYPAWIGNLVIGMFALSGFAALALEVLWTRILFFFVGSNLYSIALMLATFLFGLALGSILLSRFSDRRRSHLLGLATLFVLIASSTLFALKIVPHLYPITQSVGSSSLGTYFSTNLFARFLAGALILLPGTFFMGGIFPFVAKIVVHTRKEVGRKIGVANAANTAGAILGSLLAGFVLVPLFGTLNSAVGICILYLLLGAIALTFESTVSPARKGMALIIFILLLIPSFRGLPLHEPLVLWSQLFQKDRENERRTLLYYKETPDGAVSVIDRATYGKRIFVNLNQAADATRFDSPSHKLIAHVPLLLHQNPKEALVVGVGMGLTSRAITLHGCHVDAVEICQGVIDANSFFTEENHHILQNPLFHLTIDDGRHYLVTTDKKYDFISTGIIHPLVGTGSAGFYTADYYQLCRQALAPGGIMSQWLPYHQIKEEDFITFVRTFREVFPYTTIWLKYTQDFCILLGSDRPMLPIDFSRLRSRLQASPGVQEDLATNDINDFYSLLDSFAASRDQVQLYTGPGLLHTDDFPAVEFSSARLAGRNVQPNNIRRMAKFRERVFPYLENIPPEEIESVKAKLETYFQATQYAVQGMIARADFQYEESEQYLSQSLKINPADENNQYLWRLTVRDRMNTIGHNLLTQGNYELAAKAYQRMLSVAPDATDGLASLAFCLANTGQPEKGREYAEKALSIDKNFPEAYQSLGYCFMGLGKIPEAIQAFRQALALDTNLYTVYDILATAYIFSGESSQAIEVLKQGLRIKPDSANLWMNYSVQLGAQGKIDEAIEACQKVIGIQPEMADAYVHLGRLRLQLGDKIQARLEFDRALRFNPELEKDIQDIMQEWGG